MSKTMFNSPGHSIKPHTAPGNFEMDEIQWSENDHPVHPDFIPFENSLKKLKKELTELFDKNDKKI